MKYGEPQVDAKGNQKERKLHPSQLALKLLQEKIHHRILQNIPLPNYAYGSVKGRSNILNSQQHTSNRYFLSVDLKEVFTLINNKEVFQMFCYFKFSSTVARALTQLTTHQGKLPQGPPTSPAIANLVFVKTGLVLQQFSNEHQLTFTTSLDDLTFSSPKDFKLLIPQLLDIIKQGGFVLHHKKISYRTHKPEVTGLLIHKGKLQLVPKMQERAKTDTSLSGYVKAIKQANKIIQQKSELR